MKVCLFFTAFLLTVGLLGCKPKTVTVTGQIFIVTRGAENFKLGAVEVLLIEKSEVADYLQKKQPTIESVIASRQQGLVAAKEDAQKAQAAFNWFLTHGHPLTNVDFVKIFAQMKTNGIESDALVRQCSLVAAQQNLASDQGKDVRAHALLEQQEAIIEKVNQKVAEAKLLVAKYWDIVRLDKAEETNKFEITKSRVVTAESRLENSPTGEDYFADFSPVVFKKTLSDADGKFSFVYPRDKSFTIFASAQREVLNKTEKYYWLVDAPTNSESAQVFLSNNNLVSVDPDGYFKRKPNN
jgi:hypothetical protein